MAQYNWFGCTADDIVMSFSGAISGDFASSSYSSVQVLEMEMDYAEAEIINHLSAKVLKLFDKMPGVEPIEMVSISGGTMFTLPFAMDITKEIKGYVREDIRDCGTNNVQLFQSRLNCNDLQGNCQSYSLCSLDELIPLQVMDSTHVFWNGGVLNDTDYDVFFEYFIDKSLLNIPSFAGIIRDIVCCGVGSNLYSHEAEEWKRVTRFCEKADKMISMIDDKFIPVELRKLSYFKSILNTSIKSIKIARS
jgi:hypothetical protein